MIEAEASLSQEVRWYNVLPIQYTSPLLRNHLSDRYLLPLPQKTFVPVTLDPDHFIRGSVPKSSVVWQVLPEAIE